jgi:D-alanyl-D-alanine dipeptidase
MNSEPLVRIAPPAYDVEMFIAYGTPENFTGKPLYAREECYLHPDAAKALTIAIRYAAAMGYRFKIFDAFRPLEIQELLWEDNPDPNFISDPKTGSVPHCRGVAIDLTLIDKDGKELDMGTPFDSFSPLSYHGNTEVSQEAQRNRAILMGIMCAAGWDFYRNEWWHYQLFHARNYTVWRDKDAGNLML